MVSRIITFLVVAIACGCVRERPAPTQLERSQPPVPAAAAPVEAVSTTPASEEIEIFVIERVAEGFDTRDDIVEIAVDLFTEGGDTAALKKLVERTCDRALADHATRERSWREPTDCDRLDRAFAELESQGILARQRYSDCQTCGVAEIVTEAKEAMATGRKATGYAFYHDQDAEGVMGGALYLSYGDVDGTEQGSIAVGKTVVAALQKWGLSTRWDGSLEQRIALVDLDWKRRRTTKAPAFAATSSVRAP